MNSKLNFWFWFAHLKSEIWISFKIKRTSNHQPLLFIQRCCSLQPFFSVIICPWQSNSFVVNLKMLSLVKIEFVSCDLWPFCHHPFNALRPWSDRRVPRLSIVFNVSSIVIKHSIAWVTVWSNNVSWRFQAFFNINFQKRTDHTVTWNR